MLTPADFNQRGAHKLPGHLGINTGDVGGPATADATGSITVEALGGVSLWGSLDSAAVNQYAMIGNGSLDTTTGLQTLGNRSGDGGAPGPDRPCASRAGPRPPGGSPWRAPGQFRRCT